MESSENGFGTVEVEDTVVLIPLFRKLELNSEHWTYTTNGYLEGRSGLRHRFDFILTSQDEERKSVVCTLIKKENSNRMGRITIFYANARDVESWKAVVLSEDEPSSEEKMLLSSLGVDVYVTGTLMVGQEKKVIPSKQSGRDLLKMSLSEKSGTRKTAGTKKRKYRDRTQIIQEILKTTSDPEGTSLTRIIFRCNLNYHTAKSIVVDMLKKELISIQRNEVNKEIYTITGRGAALKERLRFYDSINGGS